MAILGKLHPKFEMTFLSDNWKEETVFERKVENFRLIVEAIRITMDVLQESTTICSNTKYVSNSKEFFDATNPNWSEILMFIFYVIKHQINHESGITWNHNLVMFWQMSQEIYSTYCYFDIAKLFRSYVVFYKAS